VAKKKKSSTRKHEVSATLDNFQLAKAGSALTLVITSKGEKIGEIHLGRGSLFWWGKNRKIRKRVRWGKFTDAMNELAYGSKD
jgi:hypothetical protein